jgi:hypothetical protein
MSLGRQTLANSRAKRATALVADCRPRRRLPLVSEGDSRVVFQHALDGDLGFARCLRLCPGDLLPNLNITDNREP